MRPVIAVILALAAAVSAAPGNTGAEPGSSLLGRQNCIYQCNCGSSTGEPNPASATCCASVGGSWDGNVCPRFPFHFFC